MEIVKCIRHVRLFAAPEDATRRYPAERTLRRELFRFRQRKRATKPGAAWRPKRETERRPNERRRVANRRRAKTNSLGCTGVDFLLCIGLLSCPRNSGHIKLRVVTISLCTSFKPVRKLVFKAVSFLYISERRQFIIFRLEYFRVY